MTGESRTRPPLSRAQKIRYAIYAAGITVLFFVALDTTIRWLEARGVLDLARENDRVWRAPADPWVLGDDGWWTPDTHSDNRVADHRFRAQKQPSAYRVFFIGESMLRGVPYTETGTLHGWFRDEITARYPTQPIEVINGSMSAINSDRVKANVGFALAHAPDLVVVQTCNNEGTLQPSHATQRLHELGTFRAFRRVLRGESDDAAPLHTPQDPDVAAVLANYRQNVREIIAMTKAAGVPLVLLMSPLNLRYDGRESGLPLAGRDWEQTAQVKYPVCVENGRALYEAKQYDQADRVLRDCEDVEALRWLGLTQFAQGRYPASQTSLEAYAEHVPRNRCRRTFQKAFREEATAAQVVMVDLDEAMRTRAPGGITGPEQFTDYCHLFWREQGFAADQLLATITSRGLGPRGLPVEPRLPSRDAVMTALQAPK